MKVVPHHHFQIRPNSFFFFVASLLLFKFHFCNYICMYRFQSYSSFSFQFYNVIQHNLSVPIILQVWLWGDFDNPNFVTTICYTVFQILIWLKAFVQDDVLENNFNILRMFIRIYGPSAAPSMLVSMSNCLQMVLLIYIFSDRILICFVEICWLADNFLVTIQMY